MHCTVVPSTEAALPLSKVTEICWIVWHLLSRSSVTWVIYLPIGEELVSSCTKHFRCCNRQEGHMLCPGRSAYLVCFVVSAKVATTLVFLIANTKWDVAFVSGYMMPCTRSQPFSWGDGDWFGVKHDCAPMWCVLVWCLHGTCVQDMSFWLYHHCTFSRDCVPTHYGHLLLAWCINVLHVQSVLLSHTVLSELYQEKLVTMNELNWMRGKGPDLSGQVVLVQYSKPPEVVAITAAVLNKYGLNLEARQLTGWWGSQTTQQWTQCNSWASPPCINFLDYCLY